MFNVQFAMVMKETEILFFELIRVAIGNADSLSHLPSNNEWKALFDKAEKQSLVGVCFIALQKLGADADEGYTRIGMSEILYLTWMGRAAKIQQRNVVVNQQCADLQKRLSADGFRSCILKGQGVAEVYGSLSLLRQSGDIDIWIEGDRDKVLNYFKRQGIKVSYTSIKHAQVQVFEDTEVEVHSRPSWFYNPIHDYRFMKWVKDHEDEQFCFSVDGMVVPTARFNLVYLLIHIYRHLFEEGIGLRQVTDYYMVIRSVPEGLMFNDVPVLLKNLGLIKFTGALMYVMKVVFGLSEGKMICAPNEAEGLLLLEEIMRGGNFGKYDERNGERKENRIARGFATMKRNMRYISSYPSEILWAPLWKTWHWCWRKKHGYI